MNTCGNCKFKGREIERGIDELPYFEGTGFFACQRIKHDKRYQYLKGQGALLTDGSGYIAALCVEDDFACSKWEST